MGRGKPNTGSLMHNLKLTQTHLQLLTAVRVQSLKSNYYYNNKRPLPLKIMIGLYQSSDITEDRYICSENIFHLTAGQKRPHRHIAALLHQHMLRSGNMRDLASCSSTGNSTPMGNASLAYQRRSTGAWTEIRSTARINLTLVGSKLNLG